MTRDPATVGVVVGDGAPLLEVAVAPRVFDADLTRFAGPRLRVLVVDDALYVDEGDLVTSAGSAAGLDACLHLLRRSYGAAAASAVARTLVVAPQRAGGQAQFVERPLPRPRSGDPIGAAMRHALEHLDQAGLDVDAVARASGFTDAVAMRPHFRRVVGVSPQQYRCSFRMPD